MTKKKMTISGLLILTAFCFILGGCSPLQRKIKEYSSDKESCSLNTDNVTQFTYQSKSYTILQDTVSNHTLGEWVGYIRQLAAVDEKGKVLFQKPLEETSLNSLTDLADTAPDAAYIIPFLNVYTASNDDTYLIVNTNGGYHKAIQTATVTEAVSVFDFTAAGDSTSGYFKLNPDNATQLLCHGVIYQVTSEIVSEDALGNQLSVLAKDITFDLETKKPLSKEALHKIDWFGTDNHQRENWFYTDICELSGTDSAEAVAVKVNDQYHIAKAQ